MSNQYIVQSKKFGKILVVTCLTAPEFFFQGIVFIALFVKKFYVIFFSIFFFLTHRVGIGLLCEKLRFANNSQIGLLLKKKNVLAHIL